MTRLSIALVGLMLLAVSCRHIDSPSLELKRFEFSEPQMGVPFSILLYAGDADQAKSAARAAFDRVAALNQVLSNYETDTELNQLCYESGKGLAVPVSAELWRVLERGDALARKTEGAFDVTVGPLAALWRRARQLKALPPADRWESARRRVGYQKMILDPEKRTVLLTVKDMRIDLGGIAKGFALDEAMAVLKKKGLSKALVSGGGDVVAGDAPPGRDGWRIEVAPLDLPGAPPARQVDLVNRALATSGDVFQRLEIDGKRYSHIVDPRTGLGLTDHSLVTVIAPDGMTADSLATTVSVLGPERGMALIERDEDVEAYIVRRPEEAIEAIESSGFEAMTSFQDREE